MFENEYKKALDSVKADGYIKQKVLKKIKEGEKKKISNLTLARTAAAIAACFAIFLSVFAIKNETVIENAEVKQNYDGIYKAVKKFKPNILDKFNYLTDDEMIIEDIVEEFATDTNAGDKGASVGSDQALEKEDSFSETTTQVNSVDEADVVKTDGKYIYSLSGKMGKLRIIKAGKEPREVSSITIDTDDFTNYNEMYVYKDKIVIIGMNSKSGKDNKTEAIIYDVSNPGAPQKLFELVQSGDYNTSRVIGDKIYLISNYYISVRNIEKENLETYIPYVECKDYNAPVVADSICVVDDCKRPEYTVICGYSISDGKLIGTQSVLGGTYTVYCSTKNIITAGYSIEDKTSVSRFSISDGKIKLEAQGEIEGNLLNQFSIDEHNDNFRFVTTVSKGTEKKEGNLIRYEMSTSNSLYVLNNKLEKIGAIENLAPDERVYSVRFMGDIAYFVTFRQIDPLFSADLSDPKNPKIIGALKIPGFSNYLYPFGDGLLLGIGQQADEATGRTGGIKLSMFDIKDPSNVTEGSKFIMSQTYSDALYSHKAVIVDKKKNIIGFSVYGNEGSEYHIFGFNDGSFVKKAEIKLGAVFGNIRGLYINNEFYIVAEDSVTVLSLNDFSKISEVKFN